MFRRVHQLVSRLTHEHDTFFQLPADEFTALFQCLLIERKGSVVLFRQDIAERLQDRFDRDHIFQPQIGAQYDMFMVRGFLSFSASAAAATPIISMSSRRTG